MNNSEDKYTYLIYKIDDFIRKYYLNKIVRGGLFLVSSALFAYLCITLFEYWGNFNTLVRSVLFYCFILGNGFVAASYIIIPTLAYFKLGNTINHEQASEIIGKHFSPVKDKLINTLQLKKLADLNPEQRSLIEASIHQKVSELKPIPFNSAIKIKENQKQLKYVLAPLALLIILFFSAPSMLSESTLRLINHNQVFIRKAPFRFEVLNEKLSVVQGDDFTLLVKLLGNEIPSDIYLEDGENSFKLDKENIVRFKYVFRNLQQDKTIRLKAGDFYSDDLLLKVVARPTLLDFEVLLNYPDYTNKKSEKLKNTGNLSVPEGSQIRWVFNAQNTKQIKLTMGKEIFLMAESGKNIFNFNLKARVSHAYSIQAINKETAGLGAVSYELKVIPDLSPTIELNEKRDSVNAKMIYFVGQASDDYGFSKLNFNYKIISAEGDKKNKQVINSLSLPKNARQHTFLYSWDINEISAEAGDEIEYYFELFDNDGVNGSKSVKSAIKTLKLLSKLDLEKKTNANTESIKKKMERAIQESTQLEKESKRLNRDLLSKKNLTYEEKKQIENLVQKQKDLESLVKEIQRDNTQNIVEQEESKEILEKQKQIEALFNNVLDENTREILKNIEKLLEQNNKKLTQEELSKVQTDNKSLQKELDRILELYKQLAFDQKLNNTIEKLKALSENQEKLSVKTLNKSNDLDELKAEQKRLQNEFKNIGEDLNDLEQKNQELEQQNNFENQEDLQRNIENEQGKSLESLKQNESKKAGESQKKAGEEIKKLSQDLEKMQQESEEKENEVNAKSLREILDKLIQSSFDQEKSMDAIQNTSITNPKYIIQGQKQKEIQVNLKMIEDSLYSLSKKVPQIQTFVNKEIQTINNNIERAIQNLGDRRTADAKLNQQFVMTSVNNLALMLNEVLEQLQKAQQNGKSGAKGKKSLSQLSKMQEQLNKNMEKARQGMEKSGQNKGDSQGKTSREMSEQLARMAREQQMIRQAMQEINKMENKDGNGSLGNLEKIIKEMEQTETDLVNKKIKQETINRQQEILGKLLEAENASQEREQEKKRESKEGVGFSNTKVLIMQEFQKNKQKEIELLKTLSPTLNSFYKIKVESYFKYLDSVNK